MKSSFQRSAGVALYLLCALSVGALPAPAQTHSVPVKDAKRAKDAARHANDAARVFKEIMSTPDKGIPKELLDKAEAVAVFPGITKAGFIVGGRGGQGVISPRITRGWSAPALFKLRGADFGFADRGQENGALLFFFKDEGGRS